MFLASVFFVIHLIPGDGVDLCAAAVRMDSRPHPHEPTEVDEAYPDKGATQDK